MSNYPHTVTVGENFGDATVEITLRFTDAAIGIGPQSVQGEALASANNASGRAVRATLRNHLSNVVDKVSDAVWTTELAEENAADLRRAEREKAAIQAAKDETAKMLGAMHDVCEQQHAKSPETRESTYAATIDRLTRERDEAVTALAAKMKRSNAAKAGHMRKARTTKKGGAR